jgi:hypothetical protein
MALKLPIFFTDVGCPKNFLSGKRITLFPGGVNLTQEFFGEYPLDKKFFYSIMGIGGKKWSEVEKKWGELNVHGGIPPYHRQKKPTHHSFPPASTHQAG